MNICIIGSGYVGLVTGACFADLGNNVTCVDSDKRKIENLKKGKIPIFEPGLKEMVLRNTKEARLSFASRIADGVKKAEVVFICVGTPSRDNGEADLSCVENVASQIARHIDSYKVVVEKSTVPVETGEWVRHTININKKKKAAFSVASNPEFLREGSAIWDFMHPDRIVLGVDSPRAKRILLDLYKPIKTEVIVTDIKSAELIKHASNCFLATKISFINALSDICDRVGADIRQVADGMGMDKRIGRAFLNAGAGWGGSCFPKDLSSFIHISKKLGYDFDLLKAVERINKQQRINIVKKIEQALWNLKGKTVAVLGLSFKPDTDDMRMAPSIDIINMLMREEVKIRAYDPQAMDKARAIFNDVKFCKDAYDAARGSDCLLLLTEWNEFKELDFARVKKLLRQAVIIDARNLYEPQALKRIGFRYTGIGRP